MLGVKVRMSEEQAGESAMNSRGAWDCVRGQILDSRFQAQDLIQPDRNGAWFRARDLAESTEALIFLEDAEHPEAAVHFDRFREAAFLNHPNLARVLATGRVACGDRNFLYIATETARFDLADNLSRHPMTVEEASDLLRQLASGLAYLHSENLTSCAVRPGAIGHVNGQWKLADYSQLRVPGQYPPAETSELLLIPAFESPPEANAGLVSAAWDVWSLGSVLRKVFPPNRQPQSVPPPFDAIVRKALDPDPNARPSLEALLDELSAGSSAQLLVPPEPAAPAEAKFPEAADEDNGVSETLVADRTIASLEPERPVRVLASARRTPFRDHRVPLIAGAALAAVVAGIVALVLPVRMLHPERAREVAQAPAPVPIAPVTKPEPREQTSHSPFGDNTDTLSHGGPRVQKEISAVINRWAEAKRRRDLDRELACYTPSVDRFYGQRNLSAAQLRREEQNVFSRIGTVRRFEISNLKFDRVTAEWALVSFDKNWDFQGRTRFAGSSREELAMRPVGGQWKISSQREVKVYWVEKKAANAKKPM
jgi:hypothetical protein